MRPELEDVGQDEFFGRRLAPDLIPDASSGRQEGPPVIVDAHGQEALAVEDVGGRSPLAGDLRATCSSIGIRVTTKARARRPQAGSYLRPGSDRAVAVRNRCGGGRPQAGSYGVESRHHRADLAQAGGVDLRRGVSAQQALARDHAGDGLPAAAERTEAHHKASGSNEITLYVSG